MQQAGGARGRGRGGCTHSDSTLSCAMEILRDGALSRLTVTPTTGLLLYVQYIHVFCMCRRVYCIQL